MVSRRIFLSCLGVSVVGLLVAMPMAQRSWQIGDARHGSKAINSAQPVFLVASIVWEGDHLNDANLAALADFRMQHPSQALMHFISPAYFTKSDAKPAVDIERIKRYVLPQDRVGLSLQGWKSLMDKSGVAFRRQPTFWGPPVDPWSCQRDCGKDVNLSAYDPEELDAIFATSLAVFKEVGLPMPRGLFVAGWQASAKVLSAAKNAGIDFDYSGVDATLLKHVIQDYPLYNWVQQNWAGFKSRVFP